MAWALVLALCLLALRWLDPLPLELMRLRTFDLATAFCPVSKDAGTCGGGRYRRRRSSRHRAMALAAYGHGPSGRVMDSAGVRMVVFAIVFAEPDRWSPARFGTVSGLPAEGVAEVLGRPAGPLTGFSPAPCAGPLVVLTQVLSNMPKANMPDRPSGRDGAVDPVHAEGRFGMIGPAGSFEMPEYAGLIDNLPVLSQAAAGVGVAALVSDVDGAVRRVAAIVQVDGKLRAGLGPEAVRVAERRSGFLIEANGTGPEALRIGERRVPVDAQAGFGPDCAGWTACPSAGPWICLSGAVAATAAGNRRRRRFGARHRYSLEKPVGKLSGVPRRPGGRCDRRPASGAAASAAGIRRAV